MSKKTLTRRSFLRSAAGSCAGLLAFTCLYSPLAGCTTRPLATEKEYYLQNQEKFKKEFSDFTDFLRPVAAQEYDTAEADRLIELSLRGFDILLPNLPYIGGDSNELTTNLVQSAWALSIYRAMLAQKHPLEETGKILYRSFEAQVQSAFGMQVMGWLSTRKFLAGKFKEEAVTSQKRKYPDDWVYEVVEGPDFDFGIDYLECGIQKYMHAQNASELMPYLCLIDYPSSESMNTGLVRTTTLAHGGDRCDFRFKMGRPCQPEWVPEFLK